MSESSRMGWVMWPFEALWWMLSFILELTGRFVAVILGIIIMIAGVIISLTLVGAVLGIPMLFFGVLLILRGLF